MASNDTQLEVQPDNDDGLVRATFDGTPQLGEFASEFRQMARGRRFQRQSGEEPAPRRKAASKDTGLAALDQPVEDAGEPLAEAYDERLTDRAAGDALAQLSRMADRAMAAREQLVVERMRVERAEQEVQQANGRIMAARALVQDAQKVARVATERCAFLEGRCEALENALDQAMQMANRRRGFFSMFRR